MATNPNNANGHISYFLLLNQYTGGTIENQHGKGGYLLSVSVLKEGEIIEIKVQHFFDILLVSIIPNKYQDFLY